MLGKLRSCLCFGALGYRFVGWRSWGAGGLASPGYSGTRPVRWKRKYVQTVSAPLGQTGSTFACVGVLGWVECVCVVLVMGFAE